MAIWNILWLFGIFYGYVFGNLYGYLEYFKDIWDILWPYGTFCVYLVHFCPVLVTCTKKNLATLVSFQKISVRKRLGSLSNQTKFERKFRFF
jgi:hypothetical protein